MDRVFNIPRRITDKRRSKQKKIALAAWLSIKFAYGNSTLYDISRENIKRFFKCGDKRAGEIYNAFWNDQELFYVNKEKNCVFAKCCKDKTIKIASNRQHTEYIGDDVIKVNVPSIYFERDVDGYANSLSIKDLMELIDLAIICKEYDKQTRYKSKTDGCNAVEDNCETKVSKSLNFVAKKVGMSRATLMRRLDKVVRLCYATKSERVFVEHMPICVLSKIELTSNCPFVYTHVIWNHVRRRRSKVIKETGNLVEDYFNFMHD